MTLKANRDRKMEVLFPKIGHFWQDSGIIGLKNILERVIASNNHDIRVTLEEQKLALFGEEAVLKDALNQSYDCLVETYFNVSSQKQLEDTENYNFYYDSAKHEFVSFPKKQPRGIAQLIFDKASRPTAKGKQKENKWEKRTGKDKSKNPKDFILPEKYAHLQKKMEKFIKERGIKSITVSGLLVDGENQVRPRTKICVEAEGKKAKGECYLCGRPSSSLDEVSATVYPLLAGSSAGLSFNPNGGRPEKACWKCSLLGKFVVENGFYYQSGRNLHMFFPYSNSLKKMDEIYPALQSVVTRDPNFNRNFDIELGSYFQKGYEIALAFFHACYLKLSRDKKAGQGAIPDLSVLWNIVIDKAPVEFYVLSVKHEGNTFSLKSLWGFQDAAYLFRFFDALERHNARIDIREVMRLLVDYDAKNDGMTLIRNRICERILKKRPIVDLIEMNVFHTNRSKKVGYIKPILDFLLFYSDAIGGENVMTKDAQEVAVTLGKRLGTAVGGNEQGRRGDLFALRRTRNMEDFLEQINRLQFRLGGAFVVPPGVYEGELTMENFVTFKQYCMIVALNSYFAAKSKKYPASTNNLTGGVS